jgi:hypothetical protein
LIIETSPKVGAYDHYKIVNDSIFESSMNIIPPGCNEKDEIFLLFNRAASEREKSIFAVFAWPYAAHWL